MDALIKREILNELKELVIQRGRVTQLQREYARVEERGIQQLHPISKPSEEKKFSHLRTLDRYIGEQAIKTMIKREKSSKSANYIGISLN